MSGPGFTVGPAELNGAAQRLAAARTRVAVLSQVVLLAPAMMPGAEHVSVTVPAAGRLVTAAASGPLARQVDEVQYRTGEGPCVTASLTGDTVLVGDVATETRWPRFTARAARLPVRAMLSVPLPDGSGVAGSLNASATTAGALTPHSGITGSAFAALAGLALLAATDRERALDRLAQTRSVVALLAHDLRSGMTVTRSAEDFLLGQRSQLDPAGQEALDLLGDELQRQERLLFELLDLARAELPSTRATALLPEVVETVGRHRRTVPVQPGPGAAELLVTIHHLRLRRILANLLDNADRHAGGATAVHVAGTPEEARVTVEDAGPGVPADRRERLFTDLMGTSTASTTGGSHLGLGLIRLHARLAGGDLRIEDRPGGGARFVLLLPTADVSAPTDRFPAGSGGHTPGPDRTPPAQR
ncbi:ATP-binding protein [Geodermatophilus sp. SYSU D00758]